MSFTVNKKSARYVKARYSVFLTAVFKSKAPLVLSGVLFLASAALVIFGAWYGWILAIIPLITIMGHEWWRHSLKLIAPLESDQPVDVLHPDVLARVQTAEPSASDIVSALKKANAGFWFVLNRLRVHPEDVANLQASPDWWAKALELYKNYPSRDGVHGGHIATALILSSPDAKILLSHSGNDTDDVLSVLGWYGYVDELTKSLTERRQSGGIARDWAVGYTPLLDTFASNVSLPIQYGRSLHRKLIGHTNVVSQMVNIFTSSGRANIALVGDVGVGKSTCIQAFAEALLFDVNAIKLRYNQVYQIDLASVLTKVKPEQLHYTIQRLCTEAYAAKNIILYFDNAGLFFGSDGGQDITNSILPIIEAGRIRMIFSFTPNQWQYLQRAKSQVVATLNYQVVQPTSATDTLSILENQILFTEPQYKCMFSYQALKEVYRLAERYGPEIAMPGRAISVLEDTARNNQNKLVTKQDVQVSMEQLTGIKIASADTEEKSVLQNLEQNIKSRVIGQDAAVKEIVSALKRSRAGVANPNKPIGTFLFLGPTGVGKTEMSKTLANVYFGGNSGLVRVDMNEYITQESVHTLLAGSTEYGTSFLETIRKQPFSVVLFDEIEKAHPDVVNTLLQLLDEGAIKDSDNRTVSFKDAIIIATSNAGADVIRSKIASGEPVEELEKHLTDDLIAQGVFKPEFVNRFDGVIIFSPLTQANLAQVVAVLLSDINKQLSQQGVQVALSEDAVGWLVSRGYDERLGARPLRRMMQKTVESAVSDMLLNAQIEHGATIQLNAEQLQKY